MIDFSKYKKTSVSSGGIDFSKYTKKSTPLQKHENILGRAGRLAGEVLLGGAKRTFQAGPAGFGNITGGLGTEFGHGVKTEVLTRTGIPEEQSEMISGLTDPQALLGSGIAGRPISGFLGGIPRDISQGLRFGKLAPKMLQTTKSLSAQRAAEARNITLSRTQAAKKIFEEEPLSFLEESKPVIERAVSKEADISALGLQRQLPSMFRRKSGEFGRRLDKLLESPKSSTSVPVSRVIPDFESALVKHRIVSFDEQGIPHVVKAPLTQNESRMVNVWKTWKQAGVENPDIVVDVKDLLKGEGAVKGLTRFGRRRTGSDQLVATVRENLSETLEESIPGLRELRSSFAPYMRVKGEAIRSLDPFSNEMRTRRAAGFIKRSGTKLFRQDEQRFLYALERELGKDVSSGVRAGNIRLADIPRQKRLIKESAQKVYDKLQQELDEELEKIRVSKEIKLSDINLKADVIASRFTKAKFKVGGIAGVASLLGAKKLITNYLQGRILGRFSTEQ